MARLADTALPLILLSWGGEGGEKGKNEWKEEHLRANDREGVKEVNKSKEENKYKMKTAVGDKDPDP